MPPRNCKWPSVREFTLDDCFPPDHIEQYVHSSLRNAGLERFDLMQFHTWEDSWVQHDRWAKKLDELKSQGLIRAIGISLNRWEPWNGVQTVRSGLIDAVQVIYNIFDQNPEDELLLQHHHPRHAQVRNVETNIAAFDAGPLPDAVHAQLRPFRWDRQPTAWLQ